MKQRCRRYGREKDMEQTIVIGAPVHCADGATGSVSRIVLNPDTNHLEYVVVHRGLFGGHDHCVPAGCIQEAGADRLRLTSTTAELKAMPDLEIHLPGEGTLQRSIPDYCAVLDKRVSIADEAGNPIGHFHGVIVDAAHQVERILLAEGGDAGIPINQVVSCSEAGLTVRLAEQVAS
jgi:hypothetical protein